jgi:hypothetical protein
VTKPILKAGQWFETGTFYGTDVLGSAKRCTRVESTKVYFEAFDGTKGFCSRTSVGQVFDTLDEFRSVEVVYATFAAEKATWERGHRARRKRAVDEIRRAFAADAARRSRADKGTTK